MSASKEFRARSIAKRDEFWAEQALALAQLAQGARTHRTVAQDAR